MKDDMYSADPCPYTLIEKTSIGGSLIRFTSAEKTDLRSSVTCGQIPVIYYF